MYCLVGSIGLDLTNTCTVLINLRVRGSFRDWEGRTVGSLRARRPLKLHPLGRESTQKD